MKTLQQCKDEVAKQYTYTGHYTDRVGQYLSKKIYFESWDKMENMLCELSGGTSDLFERLEEAAELYASQFKREWIPVTDRLPAHESSVMVYSEREGHRVGWFCTTTKNWFLTGLYKPIETVTYWMPLPESPKP